MKLKIYFSNDQDKMKVTVFTRAMLRRVVKTALRYEGFDNDAIVSISFVTNEEIHRLNREFRDVDRPTDVLSFPMMDGDEDDMQGTVVLGDVIISAEKAMAQATEYGHSLKRELAFLTAHSILHLLGYDHETSVEDEKDMFTRQEEILRIAKIPKRGTGK